QGDAVPNVLEDVLPQPTGSAELRVDGRLDVLGGNETRGLRPGDRVRLAHQIQNGAHADRQLARVLSQSSGVVQHASDRTAPELREVILENQPRYQVGIA